MLTVQGCTIVDVIKKDTLIIDYFDVDTEIITVEDSPFSEEEIIDFAKTEFLRLMGNEINSELYDLTTEYFSTEALNEELSYIDTNTYLTLKLDYEKELQNGYHIVFFQLKDEIDKELAQYEYIQIEVDVIEQEVVAIYTMSTNISLDQHQNRTDNATKSIVENFEELLNQESDEDYIMIDEFVRKRNDVITEYYYMYQSTVDETKKMLFMINSIHKDIQSVSFGYKALIDYYRITEWD